MSLRQFLMVGIMFLSPFSLGGCIESESADRSTSNADPVVLTRADIAHEGDSVVVTGLVDGVETSVVASDVTLDGTVPVEEIGPATGSLQCVICVCGPRTCVCRRVPCS